MTPGSSQHTWLENELAAADTARGRGAQPWLVIYGHKPPLCSHAAVCGEAYVPLDLFARYHVDLALWGHMHAYERLLPTVNSSLASTGSSTRDPGGTAHLVIGMAGAGMCCGRWKLPQPNISAFREDSMGYTRVAVSDEQLLVQYIRNGNGQVADQLNLTRTDARKPRTAKWTAGGGGGGGAPLGLTAQQQHSKLGFRASALDYHEGVGPGGSLHMWTAYMNRTLKTDDADGAACPTLDASAGAAEISAALALCSRSGGGTVMLSKGVFRMSAAISGSGIRDVHLRGQGARAGGTELLLTTICGTFSFSNSSNVKVSGISVDMLRQPYTYGMAVAVSNSSMTVRFNATEYPFPSPLPPASYLSKVEAVSNYDAVHGRPSAAAVDLYLTSAPVPVKVAGDEITIPVGSSRSANIKVGAVFVLRHVVYGECSYQATKCHNMTVEDVTLYSGVGMGFRGEQSYDMTLINAAVRKRGARPMSITADASHFESCSGTVHLSGAHFEGQGDDCMNVHGKFSDVRGIAHDLSAGTSVLTIGGAPHGGDAPPFVGEVYSFRNRSTWAIEGQATLKSAVLKKWTFAPALPKVTMFALLTAASLEPQVLVENSFFGNNRARGNLIKTSNVLVRNSTYHYSQGPCIQAHPDGAFWFESNAFTNWTISNSSFTGCNYAEGAGFGDITVQATAPRWQGGQPSTANGVPITDNSSQPFANIAIKDCVFRQPAAHRAVEVFGSNGVSIEGSIVEVLARRRDDAAAAEPYIGGSFDGFAFISAAQFTIHGWVIDHGFDDAHSSAIDIYVDGKKVFSAVADFSRPDLLKPGLTNHSKKGFETLLPPSVGKLVATGNHTITVQAQRKAPLPPWPVHSGSKSPDVCISDLRHECSFPQDCECGAPLPPRLFISNSLGCTQSDNICDGKPCGVGGGSGCLKTDDQGGAPTVTLGTRTYVGRFTATSQEFLGIQYAQQPVGARRWFPAIPLAPLPSAARIDAFSKFGDMCLQPDATTWPLALNPDGSKQSFSESCLVLNVFAPRNATPDSKLPVLVFGHGGGDGSGSGSMGRPLLFNSSNTVGVAPHVSVVLNYRLNTFGYMAHPAFASETNGSVGNFGLLDHLQALRWVKQHVGAFSGDASRVLFYGQSSGANHALEIPVMKPFAGLVQAVASHSACALPFFNPDCASKKTRADAEADGLALAKQFNCTAGSDVSIRACLRALPAESIKPGGDRSWYGPGSTLPDLPFNLYQQGKFDSRVKIMAGHNSGESVEMADSCLFHPTLNASDAANSLVRAFVQHNHLPVPTYLKAEAAKNYLAKRSDGLPPCTPQGDATKAPPVPRCCRVYEDFWQDLNMQCSEDVLFDAIRQGAAAAKLSPLPLLYAWRFDEVQQCPPPMWRRTLSSSCFHTMDLSWLFGTVSGFWPWVKPPADAQEWNCSWAPPSPEREFSDAVVKLWVSHASTRQPEGGYGRLGFGGVKQDWPPQTAAARARLNLMFGNISILRNFRRPQCTWWATVYRRIRISQGYPDL